MTPRDLVDRDTTERLSSDDMASVREQQHLQAALLRREQEAAARPRDVPGVCTNCGQACPPHTVYCDNDCKDDHQHRETVRARQGGRR